MVSRWLMWRAGRTPSPRSRCRRLYWHYLNIPPEASGYDRDRDCPRQPGTNAGSRGDRWRDCVVDRIGYWEERLGNPKLDRADRATALKYIVHFIGDLHQPFHALGVGRGGNDVNVRVFGQVDCGNDPDASITMQSALGVG